MATEKPTRILLSQSDMSEEEISILSDKEAWEIIYSIRNTKSVDTRLQICFTGFGATKRKELMNIAELNNFKVVSSVTKKLDFLCGNENSGVKKVEKAEMQCVQFLNEKQFIQLIETGEIPR